MYGKPKYLIVSRCVGLDMNAHYRNGFLIGSRLWTCFEIVYHQCFLCVWYWLRKYFEAKEMGTPLDFHG